VVRAHA